MPTTKSILLVLCVLFGVSTTMAATPAPTPVAGPGNLVGADFNKLPTYIKSDNLVLHSAERVFVYTGNVEVKQGDMTLTSLELEGVYDEKNQIKTLVAKNNVVIVKGEGIRATGEVATYVAGPETLTLTENPELTQEGSVLTADKITIFLNEDRSTAEGQVRVKLVQDEKNKEKKDDEDGAGKKKKKKD